MPSGRSMSMLVVRRTEPGARGGVAVVGSWVPWRGSSGSRGTSARLDGRRHEACSARTPANSTRTRYASSGPSFGYAPWTQPSTAVIIERVEHVGDVERIGVGRQLAALLRRLQQLREHLARGVVLPDPRRVLVELTERAGDRGRGQALGAPGHLGERLLHDLVDGVTLRRGLRRRSWRPRRWW